MAKEQPFKAYKETLEQYGVEESELPDPRDILAFLMAQRDEMHSMLVRELVNVVHAKGLQASENETLRLKGQSNEAEHRNGVQRAHEGVRRMSVFIDEFKKEHKIEDSGGNPSI